MSVDTVVDAVTLSEILTRIPSAEVIGDPSGVRITSVTLDHRQVSPGALHCCLPGARTDGRVFAADAAAAGAVALLLEEPVELAEPGGGPVQIVVPTGEGRPAMAIAACAYEHDPATSLKMVGVTGTNGKTTVTHLVRAIFEAAGSPTSVIGTLGGVRTTPESPILQHALAHARDSGAEAVAMEVTSHALVQHRVDGIVYDVAAFTNLTQDHLDYHETMERYFAAKTLLFRPDRTRCAVVCADDPYGRRLLEDPAVPTVGFALTDAEGLRSTAGESRFVLDGCEVRLGLGGTFNVLNALAAAAVARQLGVEATTVAGGLSAAAAVPGRFEVVPNQLGFSVVVDYAHTPGALESVLGAARDALDAGGAGRAGTAGAPGEGDDPRVIVVFGCGGDRDRAKRPLMGHIATTAAHVAVLTSDNPRSEDPQAIIDEVLAGCDGPARLEVLPDRQEAIAAAIGLAAPGDVVVIAGKGHETYQELAGRTLHFDDREVAAGALVDRAARR